MKREQNQIAALEKAIKEKYGDVTIENPKGRWTPEKEQEYIEETKKAYEKEKAAESKDKKMDLDGVLLSKKLISKNTSRTCRFCKVYSFNRDDDVCLTKFNSCNRCYIANIEGREDKWLKD